MMQKSTNYSHRGTNHNHFGTNLGHWKANSAYESVVCENCNIPNIPKEIREAYSPSFGGQKTTEKYRVPKLK